VVVLLTPLFTSPRIENSEVKKTKKKLALTCIRLVVE